MTGETGTTQPDDTRPDGARSYETAVARLDEIIGRLDSGDAELRETLELCSEARGLIEYCAGELAAVDQGLKELRLDELAASLTDSGGTTATTAGDEPEADGTPAGDDAVPF